MNQELIQKLFENAKSEGFSGDYNRFVDVVQSDMRAYKMAYDFALQNKLVKDETDFMYGMGFKKKDQSQSASPSAAPSRGSMQAQAPVEKQPSGDSDGVESTASRYDVLYSVFGDDRKLVPIPQIGALTDKEIAKVGAITESEFASFDAERKRKKAEEAAKKKQADLQPVARFIHEEREEQKLADLYEKAGAGEFFITREEARTKDIYENVQAGFDQIGISQVPEEKLSYAIELAKGFYPTATRKELSAMLLDMPDFIIDAPNTNKEFESEFSTVRDDLFFTYEKAYAGDRNAKIKLAEYVESGSIVNSYNELASKYKLKNVSTLQEVFVQGLELKNYESSLNSIAAYEASKYEEGRKFAKESSGTSRTIYQYLLRTGGGLTGFLSMIKDVQAEATVGMVNLFTPDELEVPINVENIAIDYSGITSASLNRVSNDLKQKADGIYAAQMEDIGASIEDRTKTYSELVSEGKELLAAKKAGVDIGNQIPQIVENAIVTVATGGVGGMAYGAATGFVVSAGSTYTDVRGDEYLSLGEKTLKSVINGSIEGGFELLPIFRGAETVVARAIKDNIKEAAEKSFIKRVLTDTPVGEGVQEALVSLASKPVETAFQTVSLEREIDGYKQQFRITTDEIRRQELQAKITDATVRKDTLKWVSAGEIADSFVVGTGAGSPTYVVAKGFSAVGTFASAKERAAIRSKEAALFEELAKTTDETRKAEIKKDIATLAESHNRLAMKDAIVYEAMSEDELKQVAESNRQITAARKVATNLRTKFSKGEITAEERDSQIDVLKKRVEEEFNKKKDIESKYIRETAKYDNKALDEEEIRVVKEVSSLDADIESFGQLAEGQESIEVTAENAEQVINGIVSSGKIRSTKFSTAEQITKGLRNVVSTVKSLAKSSPGVKVIVHGTKESMQKATNQDARGFWVNNDETGKPNEIHLYVPKLKANTAYHEAYHEAEFSQLKEGASQALATAFASAQFDDNTKGDFMGFVKGLVNGLIQTEKEKANQANKLFSKGEISAEEKDSRINKSVATANRLQEALDSNDLGKMIKADETGDVADEFLTELKATIETGEATLEFKTSLAGKLKEFVSRNIFGTGVGNPKTRDVVSAINASVGSMRRGEAVSLAAEAKVIEDAKRTTQARTGKAQLGARTEPVTIKGSPKGVFLNIGLLEGMTNRVIPVSEILDKLPQGVTVIEAKEVQGTEPTVSVQLSRKLTDAEMDKFLADTKQMAIPQLADGEGVIHGTTDWGPFNSEYFVLPDNKPLSETVSKPTGKAQPVIESLSEEPKTTKDRLGKAQLIHDETGFVTVDSMYLMLKDRDLSYLDSVIKHILDARDILKSGKVTKEAVIKSYLITVASQGSSGTWLNKWEEKQGKKISSVFAEMQDGKLWLRPEGIAAAYLVTDDGKQLVDDLSNGVATQDQIMSMFNYVGLGKESQKGEWTEKTQGQDGISKMTSLFNSNKGSNFDELFLGAKEFLFGVGEGKTSFFNQFIGVSSQAVLDAREYNAWVAGSMKLTEKQKELRKKAERSVGIQKELLDRIKEVGLKLGYQEDLAGYIAHHAIWDSMKNSITKHESEYLVVAGKASSLFNDLERSEDSGAINGSPQSFTISGKAQPIFDQAIKERGEFTDRDNKKRPNKYKASVIDPFERFAGIRVVTTPSDALHTGELIMDDGFKIEVGGGIHYQQGAWAFGQLKLAKDFAKLIEEAIKEKGVTANLPTKLGNNSHISNFSFTNILTSFINQNYKTKEEAKDILSQFRSRILKAVEHTNAGVKELIKKEIEKVEIEIKKPNQSDNTIKELKGKLKSLKEDASASGPITISKDGVFSLTGNFKTFNTGESPLELGSFFTSDIVKASKALTNIYKATTVKELTSSILEFTDVDKGMSFSLRKQFNIFLTGTSKSPWIKGLKSQEEILAFTREEEMNGVDGSGYIVGGRIFKIKSGVDIENAGWLFRPKKTTVNDGYINHQSYPYMVEVNTEYIDIEDVVLNKAYHATTLFSEFSGVNNEIVSQSDIAKNIDSVNKYLAAYQNKIQSGAVLSPKTGVVMSKSDARTALQNVETIISSNSAKKSGKAQNDLDAYVADLMDKEVETPAITTIKYKGRTIYINTKHLEYVKAGMAKPAIMKLLTEEVGMSKKEAEETYKRAKAYLAGNRQGKKTAYDFAKRTIGKWLDLRSREAISLNEELKKLLEEYAVVESQAETAEKQASDLRMKKWSTDEFIIAALDLVNARMKERGNPPFSKSQIESLFNIISGTTKVSADNVRTNGYAVVEAFIGRLSKIFDAQDAKAEMIAFKKQVETAKKLQSRMRKLASAPKKAVDSIQSFRQVMLEMAKIDPAFIPDVDEFISTAAELLAAASKTKTIKDADTGDIIAVVPNPEGITAYEIQAQVDRYAAVEEVFKDVYRRQTAEKRANSWANEEYRAAKAAGYTGSRADFKASIAQDIADKVTEEYDAIVKADQDRLIPATRKKLIEMVEAYNSANPNDQKSLSNWEDIEFFYKDIAEQKAIEEKLRIDVIIDKAIGDLLDSNIETFANEREFASIFGDAIQSSGPVNSLNRNKLMARLSVLSKRELLQLEFRMRDFVDNGSKYGLGQLEAALSAKLDGIAQVEAMLKEGVKARSSKGLKWTYFLDSIESFHRLLFAAMPRAKMTKIRSLLGLSEIVSGYTLADAAHAQNVKEILAKIQEIEKGGGDIMSMKSRMIAQIYSMLRQHRQIQDISEAESKAVWFGQVRRAAERSIADIKNQNRYTDKEIKEFESAFDFLFGGDVSLDDVVSDVEIIRPDVVEFVNFMVDFHNRPSNLGVFSEYVEKFLGQELEVLPNYTPIRVINRTGSATVNAEKSLMDAAMETIRASSLNQIKKVAGASYQRNDQSLNNDTSLIGLDFLAINESTIRENNTLAYTIRPMIYAAKMFNSEAVAKLIPDNVLRAEYIRKILSYAGHHRVETPEIMSKSLILFGKRITNPVSAIRTVAVAKAFGSIFTQTLKQSAVMFSVFMNTKNKVDATMHIAQTMVELAVAATKSGLWFGDKDMKIALINDGRYDLLRNSPVFLRDYDSGQINPYNGSISTKETIASKVIDKTSELALKNLKGTDKMASISSWFAFYGDYLISSGAVNSFSEIDWKKEASNPNKDAISHADNLVSKDQGASTPREAIMIYSSEGTNVAGQFLSAIYFNTIVPFTRFALNKKRSISYSLVKLAKGNSEAKKEAVSELLGNAMESAYFNAASSMLIPMAISVIYSVFGFDDEEEEEPRKIEEKRKDWTVLSSLVKDNSPIPLTLVPSLQDATTTAMNMAMYLSFYEDQWGSEKRDKFIDGYKRWRAAGNGFPVFENPELSEENLLNYVFSMGGPQGQLVQELVNSVSNFSKRGEMMSSLSGKEYYVRPEDQEKVKFMYMLKSLSSIASFGGLSFKEFDMLVKKMDDRVLGRRLNSEEAYLAYIYAIESMAAEKIIDENGRITDQTIIDENDPRIKAIRELGLEGSAQRINELADYRKKVDPSKVITLVTEVKSTTRKAVAAEYHIKKEYPEEFEKYISELRAIYNAGDKSADTRAYMFLNYADELPVKDRQKFIEVASKYVLHRSADGEASLQWYMDDIRKEREARENE